MAIKIPPAGVPAAPVAAPTEPRPAAASATAVRVELVKLPQVPADEKWVVKKGDTLWGFAKQVVGPKANDAEVMRVIAAILKEQPQFATEARKKGGLIYPGEEVKKPTGWGTTTPAPPAPTPEDAGKAEEAEAAKKAAEEANFTTVVSNVAQAMKTVPDDAPNIGQVLGQVRQILKLADTKYPNTVAQGDDATYLRSRLPDGDAQKTAPKIEVTTPPKPPAPPTTPPPTTPPPTTPGGEVPPEADRRASLAAGINDWIDDHAKKRGLTRDQRLNLGAKIADAEKEFPDFFKASPMKEARAQLDAFSPISPEDAPQELTVDLEQRARELSTVPFANEKQRRDLGRLLYLVEEFAPALKKHKAYKELQAHQPITPKRAVRDDTEIALRTMAAKFETVVPSEKERAAMGKLMKRAIAIDPFLAETDSFKALLAHQPLVAAE